VVWVECTPNSSLQMWAQRPNASTHSADLHHHDKSTVRLAGADDPRPSFGAQCTYEERPILYNVMVWEKWWSQPNTEEEEEEERTIRIKWLAHFSW
jgi:hypothetical protein